MSKDIAQQTAGTVSVLEGYTSIRAIDAESKKVIFNAINSAEKLKENIGKELALTNVIVQPTMGENEDTGEVEEYLRTNLICDDGTAYAAGSTGIVTALHNLFNVYGEPDTWDEPLVIKVVEKKSNRGRNFMTIEVV